jgi:hypothetical protein
MFFAASNDELLAAILKSSINIFPYYVIFLSKNEREFLSNIAIFEVTAEIISREETNGRRCRMISAVLMCPVQPRSETIPLNWLSSLAFPSLSLRWASHFVH